MTAVTTDRANSGRMRFARISACVATMALLSACATHTPPTSAEQEARHYQEVARGGYTPPGPPEDPWGPYVREASTRFDMPDQWIRSVMRVESGGRLYRNGELITSNVGAMGLMQVMPGTYDELKGRYDLGDDPFDPHNNILAGTAYMREMYDMYGSPGFLAAYNAGPRRLDDYLANSRALPDETRRYVAMIGPNLAGATPVHESPAAQYAMNALPNNIPGGLRYGRPVEVAQSRPVFARARSGRGRIEVAQAARGPAEREDTGRERVAYAAPAPARGFHLVSSANAAELPVQPRGQGGGKGGKWGVQVGAYGGAAQARTVAANAAAAHGGTQSVGAVKQGGATLYRARVTGLSKEAAQSACTKMAHGRTGCVLVPPA